MAHVFKNALGQFISNRPPKHVITSTNIKLFFIILNYKYFRVVLYPRINKDEGLRHAVREYIYL